MREASTVWKTLVLKWKRWPDGIVVYNTQSGNTHVLNPASTALLELLISGPKCEFEIAQSLASQNDLQLDDELQDHVNELLESLDQLGLVETVPK